MGEFSVCCWNVHGLTQDGGKKFDKIKETLEKFDIFALVETWLTDLKNIPSFVTANYSIDYVPAILSEKGHNCGGIIIGVRKSLNAKIEPIEPIKPIKDISLLKFTIGEQRWQIVTLYSRLDEFEEFIEPLNRIIDDAKMDNVLIMGDFNIRIGTTDGNKSQDTGTCGSQRKLLDFKNYNHLQFLNGKLSDTDGKFTRLDSRCNTVIDYMLVNLQSWQYVKDFYVDDSTILSNHRPLIARINY